MQVAVTMSQLVFRAPDAESWGVPVIGVPMAVAVSAEVHALWGGATGVPPMCNIAKEKLA